MSGLNNSLLKLAFISAIGLALGVYLLADGDIVAGVITIAAMGASAVTAGYVWHGMRNIESDDT